ncbi:hypothetical protein [Halorhodospira sp. 9622]|uniref:transglycosylase SLT domain-containing protein n=1 Tax=Halorhodospira sp. 9622 TaxID=2899136 RepID=UPI001EE7C12F|nr:hypothetical protein [Halorhodospira sp. 9622]MCG5538870.1 hypothetical protein [Halorhodospira sp. 9622]
MTPGRILRILGVAVLLVVLVGCAHRPQPSDIDDSCVIFEENPEWYDHARRSEERWGTPIPIQMAFVHQESSFIADARPPRRRLLGIIPWRRPSSAYGYAQAQDPVWGEYREDAAHWDAHRTRMSDALDFIGWYNQRTRERVGVDLDDPRRLYLAYHEGHGGYRRGTYRQKPTLQRVARNVESRARRYEQQLAECEDELQCWRWYQFWPFCR